jgi:hypothetical protein
MPTNQDRPPRAAGPSRWSRISTGLASVAAAGLVGGGLAACSAPPATAHTASASQPAKSATAKSATGTQPARSAAAADAGLPKFYVISAQVGLNSVLQVRASATGKVVGTVTSPSGCMDGPLYVTAAPNDRDFIFSCLMKTPRQNAYFGLRISAQGTPAKPTSLPIRGTTAATVTGLALTPDGRKLAIGLTSWTGQHATIEVVTLATGAVRSWTAHLDRPTELTWVRNGRELGFWSFGLRELDVSAAGSNLASARPILGLFHPKEIVPDAMLSPDGTTILADVSYQLPQGTKATPSTVIGGIAQVAAGTGKVLHLFIAQHVKGNAVYPCQLGPIDASGHHLLAGCAQFDRVDRGRVTALLGPDIQDGFSGAW